MRADRDRKILAFFISNDWFPNGVYVPTDIDIALNTEVLSISIKPYAGTGSLIIIGKEMIIWMLMIQTILSFKVSQRSRLCH